MTSPPKKKDRVENEHLGNMDQYRVTREVPLPYSFRRDDGEEHDYWEAGETKNSISSTVRCIRRSFQMHPQDPEMFQRNLPKHGI